MYTDSLAAVFEGSTDLLIAKNEFIHRRHKSYIPDAATLNQHVTTAGCYSHPASDRSGYGI